MVTPFYTDEWTTLFCGDCRELLPELPKSAAIVTDPPYGINYQGGGGGRLIHTKRHRRQERIIGDDKPFAPSHLMDFRTVVLFGAQHYYDKLPPNGTFHVWDKRGEYKEFHTADFDTIWVNRKETGRIFRCVWRGLCRETEHTERIWHPTQKPLRVMRWCIEQAKRPALVIDPYAGSGSTLVAAKQMGIKSIGVEISPDYCAVIVDRLRQSVFDWTEPAKQPQQARLIE